MEEDYFQYSEGNKMGIKDANGEVIIPAVYDFVIPISDGLFNVKEGEHTAYFNKEGNVVLPFENRYETYGNFSEGLARVMINEKWGFINKIGEEIIRPQFHYADDFSDGRAIVRNEQDLHGAIDRRGNLVIGYHFSVLTAFINGYAKFGDLSTWGLIDKAGNIVAPQKYIFIGDVHKNEVTVQVLEGDQYKEGVLTIGGEVKWNNNLDHVNIFNKRKEGFLLACEQLIREMYSEGCPCEYERFRDYVQWNKPVGFIDQEILFSAFVKELLDTGNDVFQCNHCGTHYRQKWEQYSAFLWVLNVQIVTPGTVENKGAKPTGTIPVTLGFYGYDIEKYNKKYVQQDIQAVMNYLREK
jgi:WG containing repeat